MNDHTNAEALESSAYETILPVIHYPNAVTTRFRICKRPYHFLHEAHPRYPDHLSHNSSSSGPCPDTIPTILTPL